MNRKSIWVFLGIFVALVLGGIATVISSPDKPTCTKEMNESASGLRERVEKDSMASLELTNTRLEKIQSCLADYAVKKLHTSISDEEILGWVRAAGMIDMTYAREGSRRLSLSGPMVHIVPIQKACKKYGLQYSDFGTSEDEIQILQRNWAEMKLASALESLTNLRPVGHLPSLEDFDKIYLEADRFRENNGLEWSAPEVYRECLRGKYYAARARALYENLRIYNQSQMNKMPKNFADAIYEAISKKGFCGYPVPSAPEVERAKKLAYARLADQLLTELRAKKYTFPDSLRKVDELKQLLKDGDIKPEELSTSEWEIQDLSRENPLGKPVGC